MRFSTAFFLSVAGTAALVACGSSKATGSSSGVGGSGAHASATTGTSTAGASSGGGSPVVFEGGVDIQEWPLPLHDGGIQGEPTALVLGPDGNIWFTEQFSSTSGAIGRITPDGTIEEFPLEPITPSFPIDIAVGPDGALWFTIYAIRGLGRITTSGAMSLVDYPDAGPINWQELALGPGKDLWLTDFGSPYTVDHLAADGTVTRYPLPSGAMMYPTLAASSGAVWTTLADALVRVDGSGSVSTIDLGGGGPAWQVANGPDGKLWFAGATQMGVVEDGGVTYLPVSSVKVFAFGPDGNVWAGLGNVIVRWTPSGDATNFTVGQATGQVLALARGAGNTVWFLDETGAKIGVLTLH